MSNDAYAYRATALNRVTQALSTTASEIIIPQLIFSRDVCEYAS